MRFVACNQLNGSLCNFKVLSLPCKIPAEIVLACFEFPSQVLENLKASAMSIYLFHSNSLYLGESGTCNIITIGISLSLWMAALFTVKRDIGNYLDKPKISNESMHFSLKNISYIIFIASTSEYI